MRTNRKELSRRGRELSEELTSSQPIVAGGGQAEVGYLIDASCRRRGYAKEALEGICQYAREKLRLRELVAHVHPDNLPSQRLLEKLNFVKEERGPFGGENEGDHWHLSL